MLKKRRGKKKQGHKNYKKYIYTPNMETHQYIRQILIAIKGEIDNNTIIVGNLTAHFH